jgi:hypothetical protein
MTRSGRETRLETERQHIRDAIQRLLAGRPQRSDGKLTISNLAAEADLTRQRLYDHHTDLITEFKTTAGGGPLPPHVQALQRRLAEANERIGELETDNALLRKQLTTLCAVITELTHETHADNIVTMPRRNGHRPSQ